MRSSTKQGILLVIRMILQTAAIICHPLLFALRIIARHSGRPIVRRSPASPLHLARIRAKSTESLPITQQTGTSPTQVGAQSGRRIPAPPPSTRVIPGTFRQARVSYGRRFTAVTAGGAKRTDGSSPSSSRTATQVTPATLWRLTSRGTPQESAGPDRPIPTAIRSATKSNTAEQSLSLDGLRQGRHRAPQTSFLASISKRLMTCE